MMKNKNIQTLENQDNFIQSLSIDKLREIESQSKCLFQNDKLLQENSYCEDLRYSNIDEYIQNMQLAELRTLEKNSQLLKQINEIDLQHKVNLTGLRKEIIILIETKKEKATLEQIIMYCNRLHIPYERLLPELFVQRAI